MTIGERIKARREALGMSVDDVAAILGKNRATVYRYENGEIKRMAIDVLAPLAQVLHTNPAYLMGWTDDPYDWNDDPDGRTASIPGDLLDELMRTSNNDPEAVWKKYQVMQKDVTIHEKQKENRPESVPPGFKPLPEMVQVPLIGNIACGTPITAEENIIQYIGIPAAWRADFALECHGDSMAPRICDGDIVCIRKQCEVETGQIAAVRIGEEATLKHFYKSGDMVQLIAENPSACPPMIFSDAQLADIKIEGLAVGFCRGLL